MTLVPSLHVEPMMDLFTLHLSPRMLPLPTMQPADTVALLPSCTDSCIKFSKRLFGFSVNRRDARSNEVSSLHSPQNGCRSRRSNTDVLILLSSEASLQQNRHAVLMLTIGSCSCSPAAACWSQQSSVRHSDHTRRKTAAQRACRAIALYMWPCPCTHS